MFLLILLNDKNRFAAREGSSYRNFERQLQNPRICSSRHCVTIRMEYVLLRKAENQNAFTESITQLRIILLANIAYFMDKQYGTFSAADGPVVPFNVRELFLQEGA